MGAQGLMRQTVPSSLSTVGRPAHTFAIAIAMFGAILAWRFADHNALSAINSLYVVPIALLAVTLGTRGGLAGAGLAMALSVLWAQIEQVSLGLDGYLARGLTFAAVALVVGWQVRARHHSQAEADRWFSISDEMCCVANFEGYFTRVNAAWTESLGYTADELMEKPYFEFVHPDDLDRTELEAAGLADPEHSTVHFENRYRAKDGSWHWLLWSSRSDGKAIYAAARDITERKHFEHTLQTLATEDTLTGLGNRRAWEERMTVETRRAARYGEPLMVAMIDLDNLKTLNDTEGHTAGDLLLRESAAGWSGAVRDTDFIARLGGDEFGVLLHNCTEDGAEAVIHRMREAMPPGHRFSAGVTRWDGEEPIPTLITRADEALYEDKAEARAASSSTVSHSRAASPGDSFVVGR